MPKRILTWAVVIFFGFLIITNPHEAASLIHLPLDVLKHAGNALASFINSL